MLAGAGENVELTDAVQQAGKQRGIRIHLGEPARHRVRHRGDRGAASPQLIERLLEPLERIDLLQLRHGERDRGAAHHVEAHARHGGTQIVHGLAGEIERRRVRDLQQPSGERRLRAHDAHDLLGRHIVVRQRLAHAHRDVREAGQVDLASGEFSGKRLNERECGCVDSHPRADWRASRSCDSSCRYVHHVIRPSGFRA